MERNSVVIKAVGLSTNARSSITDRRRQTSEGPLIVPTESKMRVLCSFLCYLGAASAYLSAPSKPGKSCDR